VRAKSNVGRRIMNLSSSTQEGNFNPPEEAPSHLLVILETHPSAYATDVSLPVLLSNLLLLINAHLSLSHQNSASLIASTPHVAKFLYPTSPAESVVHAPEPYEPPGNTMYRAFNQVKSSVTRNLQYLLSHQSYKSIPNGTQLAGALSLGLAYMNRLQIDSPLLPPSARILIASTSTDSKGQYIPIMNTIFAAQKAKIPIDVVRIAEENTGGSSTFLQQASFTTNGIYTTIKPSMMNELPQYLLQLYAADSATRLNLVFPKRWTSYLMLAHCRGEVDFRAECFCHRRICEIGYVCGVCLSSKSLRDSTNIVFCRRYDRCSTCGTKFDTPAGGAAQLTAS
jgi:transcription initiation factor TFIIH subunit 3